MIQLYYCGRPNSLRMVHAETPPPMGGGSIGGGRRARPPHTCGFVVLVCLWCACACPTIYRPGPPDNTGHNIAAEALVGASRCKGNGPALQGARAFGGGSPVREVGTSSCWAPPPSRQPQLCFITVSKGVTNSKTEN